MMPGPTRFIACPECRTVVLSETLGSGNTFGAQIWSDGFMIAPMLPDYPSAVKCRRCGGIFWLAEGHLVKEDFIYLPEHRRQIESGELAYAKHPTLPDLKRFLTQRTHTVDQESELRMRLWWGMNHRNRKKPSQKIGERNRRFFESNLYVLLHLLRNREEGGLRLRCEALRELKKFEDVVRLATEEMSSFDPGLLQILEKSRERNSCVFALTDQKSTRLNSSH